MDSYDQTTQFRDNHIEDNTELSGILEVYIHQARNIHNICIYDNQDVYAKFSLTYNPDETFSTKVVNRGGRNPEFNQKLTIEIKHVDAVLKCEMWVLSRAKSLMEDQLLGFSLVPISSVFGKEKLTQDFSLSSTDLFHSPAGTVTLSLLLNTNLPFNHTSASTTSYSSVLSSEVVLLNQTEYSMLEFPDINVVKENQQMVSEYFHSIRPELNKHKFKEPETTMPVLNGPAVHEPKSFLCLGASNVDDMVSNSERNDSIRNSRVFSSTVARLSDERKSEDSPEKNDFANSGKVANEEMEMQQKIVEMYMRSVQQFTESLANMKLPMNLEKIKTEDETTVEMETRMERKKKDGGRVFYGSRAFF